MHMFWFHVFFSFAFFSFEILVASLFCVQVVISPKPQLLTFVPPGSVPSFNQYNAQIILMSRS